MKVTFWGTRGSIPAPMSSAEFRSKAEYLLRHAGSSDCGKNGGAGSFLGRMHMPHAMTFGGDTPCVEISDGGSFLVLDCGTGLRHLGQSIMNRGLPRGSRIDIFQTHTHWDHIMGFPFFSPALAGGFDIHIHGVHPGLRERFEAQMDRIHFPITLEDMKSPIEFHQIGNGEEHIAGPFRVKNLALHHPGGSYSYRIASSGKGVVFATDGEYTDRSPEALAPYVAFFRGADMLIFDSMYSTLEKSVEKMNYGHSTPVIGIDLALAAGVKTLALFHHDPESDDFRIADASRRAEDYLKSRQPEYPDRLLSLITSYDGLAVDV
jgi:phosphoribosyl 1,2-cyclic phosphodiesterase